MLRELFRIPGFDVPIYSYGLMLVLATLAGIWLAKVLARRKGLDPELFVNAALLALLSGVIGARLSHVLENWAYYTRPGPGFLSLLWEAVNIRTGGLTYYGGFLLAFPTLVFYAIWKKVPVRVGMDIIAPCLMVGLAIGRIGCFLNGCCYGQECSNLLGVSYPYHSDAYMEQVEKGEIHPPRELYFPDSTGQLHLIPADLANRDPELAAVAKAERSRPVHPTQLYSTVAALLITALLLAFYPFNKTPGCVFALMLMIEPITRFLLEMLRVEPAVLGPMSFSMALAIPQFALGVGLWVGFGIWPKKTEANGEKAC